MILKIQEKPESEIVREIIQALHAQRKGYFWRQNNQGIYDKERGVMRTLNGFAIKGVFDILGISKSRMVTIEGKTKKEYEWYMKKYEDYKKGLAPKNKKEEHAWDQFHFHGHINKNGGLAFFSHSFQHTLDRFKIEGL